MPKVVVLNNRESRIIAQLPGTKDTAGVPITGKQVNLIPGLNLLDAAEFKLLKQNKVFASLFQEIIGVGKAAELNHDKRGSKLLEEVPNLGELPDAKPFAKVAIDVCSMLIGEIFSVEMLQKWLAEEARDEVRLLLHKQIRVLETGDSTAVAFARTSA